MDDIRNKNCTSCGLYRSAQAVCLMGRGPVPAKVMIVGEAPGFREDDIGKPFAGDAGKVLDKLLGEAGLKREDCYITNSCKCRPPDNRTPKAGEIKACKPYLMEEIKRVKPKFVLLLGATALKAALNKAKITENHGKVFKHMGKYYMPTFHPAAALRDASKTDLIRGDMKSFANLVKKGKPRAKHKSNYRVIKTLENFNECVEFLEKQKVIAFDLETSQLNRKGGEGSYINCLGLGNEKRQYILPLEHEDSPWVSSPLIQQEMVTILTEVTAGKRIIAHNGKFDNLWLREMYGVRFKLTFDTMLAAHALDENTPNGLKYLARVKLGVPDWDVSESIKQGKGMSPKKLYEYNALDVYYTTKLYYLFREQLKEDKAVLKVFKYIYMGASDLYEDAEYEGIYIDTDKLQDVERDLRKKKNKVEKKLNKLAGEGVNWNSTQQVSKILFNKWKLKPIEITDAGAYSTAEGVLKQLRSKHEGVELLLEYRKYAKLLSSFVDGWKNRMYQGRIYPSFKIHGTVTGRPSCVDPNLQQVPRESTIRSLINAPHGWVFAEADHSQVELRVTAMMSGDRAMKFIYQTGGDIHTETAKVVTSKNEVTKDERKKAKAVNFGFIYGMGAPKFQEYARDKFELKFSLDECKAYRRRFFDKYYDLPEWHDKQRKIARAFGQVRTYTGRVRRLPDVNSPEQGKRAEAERQAINSPVQGFAAEVTLMGAIGIRQKFSWDHVRVVGTVHDSILMYIRRDMVEELAPKIAKVMENPPLFKKFNLDLPVPLKAEISVGPWGSGEEVV